MTAMRCARSCTCSMAASGMAERGPRPQRDRSSLLSMHLPPDSTRASAAAPRSPTMFPARPSSSRRPCPGFTGRSQGP